MSEETYIEHPHLTQVRTAQKHEIVVYQRGNFKIIVTEFAGFWFIFIIVSIIHYLRYVFLDDNLLEEH